MRGLPPGVGGRDVEFRDVQRELERALRPVHHVLDVAGVGGEVGDDGGGCLRLLEIAHQPELDCRKHHAGKEECASAVDERILAVAQRLLAL
eukprot:CAMPEP_0181335764 /NCGR_PEP_ID=MMETSP1101-20121128/27020_1 /TAXON_ID=46948 /ORGANISM="Rhodomonas abbreviata, Strain Caron Lab Isolate" /LENGTH=91 /DNA_ID=CAMNT_0023445935 /DNA_START=240 /DNA_END=512 /DNA_ORIENTATION=+